MIALTDNDINQLNKLDINQEELNRQLDSFINGIDPINLIAPATIGNGIKQMSADEIERYSELFKDKLGTIDIKRFVPASGAASRMFKSFHKYLDDGVINDEVNTFKDGFKSFAFYDQIQCNAEPEYSCAIHNMINTIKLAELPKALIPFHSYSDGSRTAFEEHLVESAKILSGQKELDIHFTISAAHQPKFEALLKDKLTTIEDKFGCKFKISFSQQLHSTDTVAVNEDNSAFRNEDGSMLFRPGGHGSLLVNLNNLDAELVFIKNIDNIQIDHLKKETIAYKKVLGGYLISLQSQIKAALNNLDKGGNLDEIVSLVSHELMLKLPEHFSTNTPDDKIRTLKHLLNRPIRICGMVRNEGEPGGGPFWVKNKKGEVSLQIVESSQVNLNDNAQKEAFSGSTHFNPVDLVCWLKDSKGKSFDLANFTDPETAFISEKSQQGKNFKVLEHPGLWNGSMADWITIFVEVPIESFSPVKTINDLLRPQHQPA